MDIEGGPLSKGTEKMCKGIITKKKIPELEKEMSIQLQDIQYITQTLPEKNFISYHN